MGSTLVLILLPAIYSDCAWCYRRCYLNINSILFVTNYCLLFFPQILTHRLPFESLQTYQEWNECILNNNRPDLPSAIPSQLKEIIHSGWSLDPSSRASAEEIVNVLQSVKTSGDLII